jgi:hypothetical protein
MIYVKFSPVLLIKTQCLRSKDEHMTQILVEILPVRALGSGTWRKLTACALGLSEQKRKLGRWVVYD